MQIHSEKYFSNDLKISEGEPWTFIRLDPQCPDELAQFLSLPKCSTAIPMLSAGSSDRSLSSDQSFIAQLTLLHTKAALALKARGYQRVVLAADDDGVLQKLLSPRFFGSSIEERSAPLMQLFGALASIIEDLWVSLTLEELAPGGFDATDGLYVLHLLERQGLKNALIAAGTRDFPALYRRRMTRRKEVAAHEFCSHEPDLATAQWAARDSNCAIWALALIADQDHAAMLASKIGLSGLVKRSTFLDL